MGLDGGTYITRSDVLRGQSWELNKAENSRSTRGGSVTGVHKKRKLDRKTEQETKWTTCTLSGKPLQAPLVADFLGSLFNREAVLEFLLARSGNFADVQAEHRYVNQLRASGTAFEHLQSLRDTFAVLLGVAAAATAGRSISEVSSTAYACPITDLPCEQYPFAALCKCGHVFSERAIQQMTEKACSICSRPFIDDHVVPINGTEEQVVHLREELDFRQRLVKEKKALKKRKLADKEDTLEILSTEPPAIDVTSNADGGFGSPVI